MTRPNRKSMSKPILRSDSPGAIYLRRAEFVTLATSRQKLLRADEPSRGVRGLIDPKTGSLYLIEVSRLCLP